ncbi:MAG: hypothetical protein ACXW2R_02925, partial [Candidatus Aminicenantales bacterium]
DENDKYCNNCGTQLLFSEDEEIEEEIPGEKIIEAVVEEKDYTVDEPADEKRPAAKKDLDAEIDEELEEEPGDQKKPTALDELMAAETGEVEDEDVTKEVILVDEIEAAVAKAKDGSAALDEDEAKKEDEEDAEEEELADELEEDVEEELEEGVKPAKEDETREYASIAAPIDKTVESPPEPLPSSPEEPDIAYVSESETPDDTATAGEAGLRPVTFDSRELENLGKTVDLGREKIDQLLEVMTSKKVETGPVSAEPAPEKPADPPTGTLPPWASTMRGAPVFPEDTGPVETRKIRGGEPASTDTEEIEIFPRQRPSDSTMGLPEKVSQAPLPFERPTDEAEEGEEEREEDETAEDEVEDRTPEEVVLPAGQVRPAREPILPVREPEIERPARMAVEAAGEIEEPAPRPPFSFSVFIKSKTFDLLFVGLFWLVALWLAASSMGLTLFDILGSMSGSMLLLYAVFVLLYFFLFKFFLGETLGDRLFRPRD